MHTQSHNRRFRAAMLMLLCVIISVSLLFAQLVEYTGRDSTQYIPLTRSNGITTVMAGQEGGQFRRAGFSYNPHVVLAAKPVLTASWFRVKDENTVWQGDTRVEIFLSGYGDTVRSASGDKVVAPGTGNSYTFALENTAQGNVEYEMTMKAWFSLEGEYPIPVEVTVTRDTDKAYLAGSAEEYADVLALNSVKDSGKLSKGYVMPYTLTWQWPFEGDDGYDTLLGNLREEEDLTLTIEINTYATYTPKPADDGIPKTGDTHAIGLWMTCMVLSAAGLMLLILMRRRGEENETC